MIGPATTGPFPGPYQILQGLVAPQQRLSLVANSLVKRSKAASSLGGFSFLLMHS
jgi:hypothetical protein